MGFSFYHLMVGKARNSTELKHNVWKSHKKSQFTLRAKRATFFIRQIALPDRSKISGKCQNWKVKMRHFGWFSNNVMRAEEPFSLYTSMSCDLLSWLHNWQSFLVALSWPHFGIPTVYPLVKYLITFFFPSDSKWWLPLYWG